MFSLEILYKGLKKALWFISGAAVITYFFKFFNGYLKIRAVKKSQIQGLKDHKAHQEKTEDAEAEWIREGKKTDSII